MSDPKQLTSEATQQFEQGLSMIFSRWWALRMAVENGSGGPHSRDKAIYFSSRVFNFFIQPNRKEPIYIDDVEELLDEGLDSFNTRAEDGSVEEVAFQLMIMHQECVEGNYLSVQKLRETKAVPIPHVKQATDSDEDEDEDEEDGESVQNDGASSMMLDSPNPNPTTSSKSKSRSHIMDEADDGWVTVPSRKARGKKKLVRL